MVLFPTVLCLHCVPATRTRTRPTVLPDTNDMARGSICAYPLVAGRVSGSCLSDYLLRCMETWSCCSFPFRFSGIRESVTNVWIRWRDRSSLLGKRCVAGKPRLYTTTTKRATLPFQRRSRFCVIYSRVPFQSAQNVSPGFTHLLPFTRSLPMLTVFDLLKGWSSIAVVYGKSSR